MRSDYVITQTFMRMLTAFKLDKQAPLCQFITIDRDTRHSEANLLGHHFLGDGGLRPPVGKGDPDYKFDHYKLFSKFDITWPVDFTTLDIQFPDICSSSAPSSIHINRIRF